MCSSDLVAPASSASSSRLVVQFSQQGKSFDAEVVEPVTDIGGGVQRIVVKVPQSVIAGVADISLVRVDTVYGLDTCTGSYTTVEQPSASNRFRIGAVGNYVVAALRGAGQLAVMTQGDPFAASPASEIDIVARIPVGSLPRDTALTADHTRAYVTLQGDGAVGVVDLVAMQKSDAKPGNAATPGGVDPVDTIALPPGARRLVRLRAGRRRRALSPRA